MPFTNMPSVDTDISPRLVRDGASPSFWVTKNPSPSMAISVACWVERIRPCAISNAPLPVVMANAREFS